MTIKITRFDSTVRPLHPDDHQVRLDASEIVSRGVRAICICGTVAEGLYGSDDVLSFLRSHRNDDE